MVYYEESKTDVDCQTINSDVSLRDAVRLNHNDTVPYCCWTGFIVAGCDMMQRMYSTKTKVNLICRNRLYTVNMWFFAVYSILNKLLFGILMACGNFNYIFQSGWKWRSTKSHSTLDV